MKKYLIEFFFTLIFPITLIILVIYALDLQLKMDSIEKQQELKLWSEKVSDEIILGNRIYWNNGSIEVGPIRSATGYIFYK